MEQRAYQDFVNFFRSNPGCRVKVHMEYLGEQTKVCAQMYKNDKLLSIEGIVSTCDVSKILINQDCWRNDYCSRGIWSTDFAFDT